MKSVILKGGSRYYTYLGEILSAIHQVQKNYNWLITDYEGGHVSLEKYGGSTSRQTYYWLTGEELTNLVEMENSQWVWAVLSGFHKQVSLDTILTYELPYADCNRGFWQNPVTLQHPLAELEIVPWDSSCVLMMSKEDFIVDNFIHAFPTCYDLEQYNENASQMDQTDELNKWLKENK